MAEDDGEKTEAPTPRRKQEARDAGQIARSQDLTTAALMLAAVLLLTWYGPPVVTACRAIMEQFIAREMTRTEVPQPGSMLMQIVGQLALPLAPIFLGLMVVAVLANVAQVGLFFQPDKVAPNWAGLNPVKGLSRIFGAGQGVVSLLMNLLKMTLIGWVAYSAVGKRIGDIINASELTYQQVFALGGTILHDLALRIAVLMLVLAILDYAYQKYKINKSLKMTKQEVKDEMKSMDGDPHIKQRRRQLAMQRHVQRMKTAVPQADVIVTNPTHYAIALQYDSSTMTSPKVVAKGADFLALKIREIASSNGIPILERPPLARALYRTCEVGQEIPEEYYSAVAEILAYVYEISGRSRVKVPA